MKFSDGISKYLPLMSCSFVEIMCLFVVLVCINEVTTLFVNLALVYIAA